MKRCMPHRRESRLCFKVNSDLRLRALGMFEGQLLPFVISLYASITITTLATADVMLLVVFLQSHDEDLLQEAASGTDMDGRKAVMNGETRLF